MEAIGTNRRPMESECRSPLICALSVVGGALFLLGVLRLISGFTTGSVYTVFSCFGGNRYDPTPAWLCFKLAGWFATAGWLLQHIPCVVQIVARKIQRPARRFQAIFTLPGDGILEMILAGLFFIVLLVLGMVSLWASTVH